MTIKDKQNKYETQATAAEAVLREFLSAEGEVGEILRSPDNDIGNWTGFVRISPPEIPGMEQLFLVSDTRVLSSRQPARDFRLLMLDLQNTGQTLTPGEFVPFFLRFRALRRGVLLHRTDEHPLLRPEQWENKRFTLPHLETGKEGLQYDFWIFDTARYEPIHFTVTVDREGHTEFNENSAS
ncbi:MAG: hypothetical protein GY950_32315 [bacterium]|nr:hypothetical protein [bacterium]